MTIDYYGNLRKKEGLKLIVLAFFKVVAINQIFPQRVCKISNYYYTAKIFLKMKK